MRSAHIVDIYLSKKVSERYLIMACYVNLDQNPMKNFLSRAHIRICQNAPTPLMKLFKVI